MISKLNVEQRVLNALGRL